jgi:hypothetical protein
MSDLAHKVEGAERDLRFEKRGTAAEWTAYIEDPKNLKDIRVKSRYEKQCKTLVEAFEGLKRLLESEYEKLLKDQ